MSTRTADYDYELPEELIADRPAASRDGSRLLLVDRRTQTISHHAFGEFEALMPAGSLAVFNNTKVIPARLFDRARNVETLLLEQLEPLVWKAMVKPGRKMRPGDGATFGGARATVTGVEPDGTRILSFDAPPDIETHGVMPLPPYIRRESDDDDRHRYQTVYAEEPGAVAAPTAGLHFTKEIYDRIPHAHITLHVGAGTFKPVQDDDLSEHTMHSERFSVGKAAADAINSAASVLAVGTTVVRVLESVATPEGHVAERTGSTDIFIHPPYEFRATGHLLTNFHLPKSTLLMLVSAFAGREFILEAYRRAVAGRYRFFSYGDCMLIL